MAKLKVFISWSGERSKLVGEALRQWLPDVLQGVEPWLSAADIDKGEKWNQAVSGNLTDSDYSIICLTPENLQAPWILFEAGALSKNSASRVCTYLYDLAYADVKDPLSQFQHSLANKEETHKLVASINKGLGAEKLDDARLERVFERAWQTLESQLASIAKAGAGETHGQSVAAVDPGKFPDILIEILTRTREHSKLLAELAQDYSGIWEKRGLSRLEFLAKHAQRDSGFSGRRDLSRQDLLDSHEELPEVVQKLLSDGVVVDSISVAGADIVLIDGQPFPYQLIKDYLYRGNTVLPFLLRTHHAVRAVTNQDEQTVKRRPRRATEPKPTSVVEEELPTVLPPEDKSSNKAPLVVSSRPAHDVHGIPPLVGRAAYYRIGRAHRPALVAGALQHGVGHVRPLPLRLCRPGFLGVAGGVFRTPRHGLRAAAWPAEHDGSPRARPARERSAPAAA